MSTSGRSISRSKGVATPEVVARNKVLVGAFFVVLAGAALVQSFYLPRLSPQAEARRAEVAAAAEAASKPAERVAGSVWRNMAQARDAQR